MSALDGKRILITGATSGIGQHTAVQLAGLGASLVLACRDAARGTRTAQEIERLTGSTAVEVLPFDAARPASVRALASAYRASYPDLDVLVNNAGVLAPQRQTGPGGLELTFATNVLGYDVLTRELLGVLAAGSPGRVVNVASTYAGELDLDDLQFQRRPYDGMAAYAQSKACNRLLTWALARRLPPGRVTANAVAPGLVRETGLYDDLPAGARRALEQLDGRTVAEGADTVVWLASSSEVDGVTGELFEQRTVIPCELRSTETEERLWACCESLAAVP